MIGTGVLDEARRQIGIRRIGWPAASKLLGELGPAGESVLARERVLHVAKRRMFGRDGERSLETSARVANVGAKRFQPALRFPLEILEGTSGRDTPGHDPPSVIA